MTAIVDSLFSPNRAIHANGDRHGFEPAHVRWEREEAWNSPFASSILRLIPGHRNVWYTDGHIPQVPAHERSHKAIGLLLQPAEFNFQNYTLAENALKQGHFDLLFTHDPHWFADHEQNLPENIHIYPLGGTRIHSSDWRIWEHKDPCVSAIASSKRGLPGHWLRHEVIAEHLASPGFYAYGPDYIPLPRVLDAEGREWESKLSALAPYMFSLAIEPVSSGYFLSEHVLDCFLTGTVPIYWGPPDALSYWGFDPLGVIRANRKDGLVVATRMALNGANMYNDRLQAIRRNFVRAHEYTCTEDWLYRQHPDLFDK